MFFVWNVGGLNSQRRQSMTKEWINIHKPLFGDFLETHIQPSNSRRILSSIPPGWKFYGNFDQHMTARLVVVWDPRLIVTIYKASPQLITCGIFLQAEDVSFKVSFVYGFNQVEERRPLWEELACLNANTPVSRLPWAVVEDFNQILRISQHSEYLNRDVDVTGLDDFNLALQEADLFEAQEKGLVYTWWNNCEENPISKKIDHALINHSWATTFSEAYVEFFEPLQSDHSPCLFVVPSLKRNTCKPFKFFHHVIDHPRYSDSVRQAWEEVRVQGTTQFRLVRSLKTKLITVESQKGSKNKLDYSGPAEIATYRSDSQTRNAGAPR